MLIRPGFSYWWTMVPPGNAFGPTSVAYATLRLWALAQIADANHVKEICVAGADTTLEEVLTIWCNDMGRQITIIPEEFTSKDKLPNKNIRSRIERALPSLINGLGFIALQYRYYFTGRRPQLPSRSAHEPSITIVDYLANLDVQAAQGATYTSNYWGPLAAILPQLPVSVNWIHIEVTSAAVPDVRSARAAIQGLNRENSSSRHVLLQDYLTLRVAWKAAAQYLRIRRITKQLATRRLWVDAVSGLDIYPLVRSSLHSDLKGTGAARNALWLSLFEEALPAHAAQDPCIYLMENQPWELALLQTRIAHGGGANVGVAHVPIRTWDFRYALGSSSGGAPHSRSLPAPSRVAVIDPASEAIMIANGLKPSSIIKVEALRFLLGTSTTTAFSNRQADKFTNLRVLIFGAYDALTCAQQLQLLEELSPLAQDCTFIFRPHPARGTLQRSLPKGVSLSKALTVGKDLAESDVVLCSNVSSASLDASLRGIPILMLREGRTFNGSLLIAGPSVTYVNDAVDIIGALGELKFGVGPRLMDQTYPMYLDEGLTRWRALLDLLIKK